MCSMIFFSVKSLFSILSYKSRKNCASCTFVLTISIPSFNFKKLGHILFCSFKNFLGFPTLNCDHKTDQGRQNSSENNVCVVHFFHFSCSQVFLVGFKKLHDYTNPEVKTAFDTAKIKTRESAASARSIAKKTMFFALEICCFCVTCAMFVVLVSFYSSYYRDWLTSKIAILCIFMGL